MKYDPCNPNLAAEEIVAAAKKFYAKPRKWWHILRPKVFWAKSLYGSELSSETPAEAKIILEKCKQRFIPKGKNWRIHTSFSTAFPERMHLSIVLE